MRLRLGVVFLFVAAAARADDRAGALSQLESSAPEAKVDVPAAGPPDSIPAFADGIRFQYDAPLGLISGRPAQRPAARSKSGEDLYLVKRTPAWRLFVNGQRKGGASVFSRQSYAHPRRWFIVFSSKGPVAPDKLTELFDDPPTREHPHPAWDKLWWNDEVELEDGSEAMLFPAANFNADGFWGLVNTLSRDADCHPFAWWGYSRDAARQSCLDHL